MGVTYSLIASVSQTRVCRSTKLLEGLKFLRAYSGKYSMSQLFSVSTSKLISTVLILLTDPGFQARMAGGRAVFLPQACPTLSFPPPRKLQLPHQLHGDREALSPCAVPRKGL